MGDVLPFPLAGRTLIVGPSGAGKTRLTARALGRWLDDYGPTGVVVFEFGPDYPHEGRILGGHLDRFIEIPSGVWRGTLAAAAPRARGSSIDESVDLAASNARRARAVFRAAPSSPSAVFVNDATIPFQHEAGDLSQLTTYCDRAQCAVLNAFESEELGTGDPVSTLERNVIERLRRWADHLIELPDR